ncbi:hypothetical protein, partial [Burkholderia ubonensis]|uniref:hypothetical protein n=1 Tax=Burkholderia ubonensis TaxID=101571 RepID=UPI001E61C699
MRTEVENQDFVVHGCGRDEEQTDKKSSASRAASKAWTAASGETGARRTAGHSCIGGRSSSATSLDALPDAAGAPDGAAV